MDRLIDNLARELAQPTSRRGALRLIGGAMFGGLVAAWAPSSLNAQTCSPACSGKKPVCCTTGTTPFCVASGQLCCGNTSCGSGKKCCTTGGTPFCTTNGKTCCGTKACSSGQTCCNNTACCSTKQACVQNRCQASNG